MYADDIWFGACVAGAILGLSAVAVILTAAAGNRSEYISMGARIEQLRQDVRRVDVAESEDVIGQVTEANQRIAANRRWNRVPIVNWVIPDGWDTLAPITLPERAR